MERNAMRLENISSLYESSARERISLILDAASFQEILPPSKRISSPHLKTLGMPIAFDDGIVIGEGLLEGRKVFCAAQEPGFMGGSVGEVHGAKLTGLLERAAVEKPAAVILILDTGGVRLHEANAGLIAISEIQRALFKARSMGVVVIAISAGSNGIYGGFGIVARCCDYVLITEQGRLSVSGPEVIESQKGVEEFDARDKALVWRTMGGKHRYLQNEAQAYTKDSIENIRASIVAYFGKSVPLSLEELLRQHKSLGQRLEKFSGCADAVDIWAKMGIQNPDQIPSLDDESFIAIANRVRDHD